MTYYIIDDDGIIRGSSNTWEDARRKLTALRADGVKCNVFRKTKD